MPRIPYRKSYEVVGYAYEADLHCVECATVRFGQALDQWPKPRPNDNEGNEVSPIFLDEAKDSDVCRDCRKQLTD